ncbi:MAG TPA: serine hydrolase domain-containing protein, partial [Candidatus Baltobacteraceae bacterium]|nr:serine hydrolase domain-containing protein [Candidatus Baltobacteraceae bacterium]
MHKSRLFAAAFVATYAASLFAPTISYAQGNAPTMDDAIAAIEAYAPRALAEQGAPGMSVAITDRTHTLKIITAGYANIDAKQPVTAATRFPIGSISKSMTALALLQLHDRGKIDLNAPVQTYLPWWKIASGGTPVLVHQLLSHTAGVPDDYTFVSSYGFATAALRASHTLFTPGTSWSYSNDGLATAGAIVAAVGGAPWQDQIVSSVFNPIGMSHSSAYFTPKLMSDAAVGYLMRDQDIATPPNPALVPAENYDFVDPAGSVISTPEDMAQYMRFYLNDGKTESGQQLIAPATFTAMTTPDTLKNGKPAGSPAVEMAEWPDFYKQYGYGLSIFNTDGDHLIGHTGGVSGYTACMQANLTRGFGVI